MGGPTTSLSLFSQMPPSLGQQALANSFFTDGDEGEDLKMQPPIGNEDDSFGDATQDYGDESEDVPLLHLIGDASKDQKLTYQFVAKKATNLVRLAQTDQVRLGLLCNLLEQLTSRIRNGRHSIEVLSFDTALPLAQENLGATPVLGTLKSAPNTYNQQRRMSRHETWCTFATKRKNPLSLALLAIQMIWPMFHHHVRTQKIAQYVAFLDTSKGHAPKSTNSKCNHWT
jgi:hypothetical protein